MTAKLVIFDVDGVLIDSEKSLLEMNAESLAAEGIKVTHEQLLAGFGIPPPTFYFHVVPGIDKETVGRVYERQKKVFTERIATVSRPFPDAKLVLSALRKRKLKLAAVSGTPEEYLLPRLKSSGLASFLDFILGSEVAARDKPYPDQFNYVLDKLSVASSETMAVGDTRNDLLAAKAAGCVTVVLAPKERQAQFADLKPDHYITTLGGILPLV